jgi:hypothetical protein
MANCFKPKTVANVDDFTIWSDAEQFKVPSTQPLAYLLDF